MVTSITLPGMSLRSSDILLSSKTRAWRCPAERRFCPDCIRYSSYSNLLGYDHGKVISIWGVLVRMYDGGIERGHGRISREREREVSLAGRICTEMLELNFKTAYLIEVKCSRRDLNPSRSLERAS